MKATRSRRSSGVFEPQDPCSRLNDQLEEALGREHQELQSLLDNLMRRVERRKQEHVRRQREVLQRYVQAKLLKPQKTVEDDVPSLPPVEFGRSSLCASETDQPVSELNFAPPSEESVLQDAAAADSDCGAALQEKLKAVCAADGAPGQVPDPAPCGRQACPEIEIPDADAPDTVRPEPLSEPVAPQWLKPAKTAAQTTSERRPLYPSSWRRYVHPDTNNKRKTGFLVKGAADHRTRLELLTGSRQYEWFSSILIVLNAVFIGFQTDWIANEAASLASQGLPPVVTEPNAFFLLQGVFTLLFAVELAPRWIADGFKAFFQTPDRLWNSFDVFVVGVSFVDFVATLIEKATVTGNSSVMGNVSVLRVARVLRILRVARVIRVMRFFRELRMMIYSILGSMKALLWSVAVLTLMFFIFGISLTLGTIYHLDTIDLWQSAETEDLRRSFGSLPRSILSLYMAMSGGRNWGDFFRILLDVSGSYSLLFLLFVTVAIFAVGNVVTGIFVENALESNQTDKETLVQDEMEARKDYFSHMQEVFEELDDDTDGVITMDEFERKLDDERVIAYFNVLNLDVSDARMLFTLLDYDQSGEVAIEEFLAGCNKLKGESRSLDLAIMQLEVRWLKEAFLGFADFMADSMNKNNTDGGASPTRRARRAKTMT